MLFCLGIKYDKNDVDSILRFARNGIYDDHISDGYREEGDLEDDIKENLNTLKLWPAYIHTKVFICYDEIDFNRLCKDKLCYKCYKRSKPKKSNKQKKNKTMSKCIDCGNEIIDF